MAKLSCSQQGKVKIETDPIDRQFTQWQSSLSRLNSVNYTYIELCRK